MEAIKRIFTPEFRNRLDAIVQFKPLAPETIVHVVDKFIIELEAQLEEKHVSLELSDGAREWLGLQGYDPTMGARPMARTIQDYIKKPLAEELLFAKLAKGGRIKIGVKDDKLDFKIDKTEEVVKS